MRESPFDLPSRLGIRKDDEIVLIQKTSVKDLDLPLFNEYLKQIPLTLVLRSARLTSERLNVLSPNELFAAQQKTTKTKSKLDLSCSVSKMLNNTKNEATSTTKTLSNAERLEKIIGELIETEKSYVQVETK